MPACAVEFIDDIIAERGVTECSSSTGSSDSTQTSSSETSSTGTGTSTSTDDTSDATTSTDGQTTTSSSDEIDPTTGAAPVCGNGIIEPGEDCDDATTFCNAACIKSRFVFVTSGDPALQAGAIDGLIGADYQCRHRAAVMNFPNAERYRAWISTSTVDARDRVEHHAGRYILVNGLIVAENWDEFASDSHQNPINVTEQSQTLIEQVWTGTQPDGTRVPAQTHCQDWTSSSASEKGYAGDSTFTDASWTLDQLINPIGCVNNGALYCIEQP
jgi:hypothetical protein